MARSISLLLLGRTQVMRLLSKRPSRPITSVERVQRGDVDAGAVLAQLHVELAAPPLDAEDVLPQPGAIAARVQAEVEAGEAAAAGDAVELVPLERDRVAQEDLPPGGGGVIGVGQAE